MCKTLSCPVECHSVFLSRDYYKDILKMLNLELVINLFLVMLVLFFNPFEKRYAKKDISKKFYHLEEMLKLWQWIVSFNELTCEINFALWSPIHFTPTVAALQDNLFFPWRTASPPGNQKIHNVVNIRTEIIAGSFGCDVPLSLSSLDLDLLWSRSQNRFTPLAHSFSLITHLKKCL